MGGSTVFLYHDDFLKYQFGAQHPFQPVRERMTLDTLQSLGALDDGAVVVPRPADMDSLLAVHLEGYIKKVREALEEGRPPRSGRHPGPARAV